VDRNQQLTADFEQHRARLRGVAYRMLGSVTDADDAVQEAWLRLNRAGGDDVENLGGWLTTVIARVCLDMLRSRTSRREDSLDAVAERAASSIGPDSAHRRTRDPEQEAMLADSVGLALLVVLDTLSPAERLAFVLHDLFGVPFDDIAHIVQRTPEAARQLASRARRRVRGHTAVPDSQLAVQRDVVRRFLAALRAGDVEGLVAVLDPDVVVRVDAASAATGRAVEVRGARTWATGAVAFAVAARSIQPALVDGSLGLVLAPGGRLQRVLRVTFAGDRIAALDVIAEPAALRGIEIAAVD
jgi:RNA polymerase sigma-70 factor (ECF subfamily)